MTTPNTPAGFDISYVNSWDYLFNPDKYMRQELIRRYGYPVTPQAQQTYEQIILKSQEKLSLDDSLNHIPCNLL